MDDFGFSARAGIRITHIYCHGLAFGLCDRLFYSISYRTPYRWTIFTIPSIECRRWQNFCGWIGSKAVKNLYSLIEKPICLNCYVCNLWFRIMTPHWNVQSVGWVCCVYCVLAVYAFSYKNRMRSTIPLKIVTQYRIKCKFKYLPSAMDTACLIMLYANVWVRIFELVWGVTAHTHKHLRSYSFPNCGIIMVWTLRAFGLNFGNLYANLFWHIYWLQNIHIFLFSFPVEKWKVPAIFFMWVARIERDDQAAYLTVIAHLSYRVWCQLWQRQLHGFTNVIVICYAYWYVSVPQTTKNMRVCVRVSAPSAVHFYIYQSLVFQYLGFLVRIPFFAWIFAFVATQQYTQTPTLSLSLPGIFRLSLKLFFVRLINFYTPKVRDRKTNEEWLWLWGIFVRVSSFRMG